MKNSKTKNTEKTGDENGYYFIKPFEISSSYNLFIDTWIKVNKLYKEINEVTDAGLMQSLSDDSKYGYISYSDWETKESYVESNQQNTVLRYHTTINGNGSGSANHYLYKLMSGENYNGDSYKANRNYEILLCDTELSYNEIVRDLWSKLCDSKKPKLASSYLYKSVYKKSKFRYVGFLYYNDNDIKSPDNNSILKKSGCKIYSSFYKKVKKY